MVGILTLKFKTKVFLCIQSHCLRTSRQEQGKTNQVYGGDVCEQSKNFPQSSLVHEKIYIHYASQKVLDSSNLA